MRKQILTEASVSLHLDKNKVGNAYFLSCIVHLAFQDQDREIEKSSTAREFFMNQIIRLLKKHF